MRSFTSRHPARRCVALLLLALVLCLPACAGGSGPAPPGFTTYRPLEPRVDAVAGAVLALPLRIEGDAPTREPDVRLDDGRRLPARLWWVAVEPDGPDVGHWLPPTPRLRVIPFAEPGAGVGPGAWVLTAGLPRDAFGAGLWVARTRVPMQWLPDPRLLLREVRAESATSETPWDRPAPPTLLDDPLLRAQLAPFARDPARRWRHRLLADGLEPPDEPYRPGLEGLTEAPGSLADPVLEAIARQGEARWRVGLAWLWRADPALAQRLKRRLVATVDFPGEGHAPAWPDDGPAIDELRRVLTDPDVTPETRRRRVRQFLESEPERAAWLIEALGPIGVRATPTATIGLANLTDTATLAWLEAPGPGAAPVLTPLSAWGTIELSGEPDRPTDPLARTERVELGVQGGRWGTSFRLPNEALGVTPPGLAFGPLETPWSARAWRRGETTQDASPGEGWASAGLVSRVGPGGEAGRDWPPGWTLYIECAWLRDTAHPERESVTVHLGPRGFGRWVRVFPDGRGEDQDGRGVRVLTERSEARWRAWVALPSDWAQPGGALLAVERLDARGVRTTWPHRVLPWQTDPGRALLDLERWDPLSAPDAP